MTKQKSTKKTLLTSVLSLVLCVAMLIGTTFAWFTDSAISANNKIVAGNLDVQLLMHDGSDYKDISASKAPIFGDANSEIAQNDSTNTLWEPGKTQVAYLAIKNNGSLDLKYMVALDVENPEGGKDLYKAMQYTITPDVKNGAITAWDATNGKTVELGVQTVSAPTVALKKGETHYFALSVHMMESAGNEYQGGQIDFDLTVLATQLASELDSFDHQYDKNAWLNEADTNWYVDGETTYEIKTAAELAGLAKLVNAGNTFAGKTIKIMNDIDLNGALWTPIGVKGAPFNGTLEGQGYTIYNLNVVGTEGVGLVGVAGNAASIYNVNITNATVTGTHYVGAVLGYGYLAENCLKNCTVTNATITSKPELVGGVYDNGDKAGVIAGWAANGHITGNKAVNSTVKAYRDFGGIVGCAQSENRDITVKDNTVDNVTLIYIIVDNYVDNKANQNVGEIVGRLSQGTYKVTVGENTVKETTLPATPVSSQSSLVDAVKKGEDVVLTADVEASLSDSAIYGTPVAVIQKGGVLDGNGYSLDIQNPQYNGYAIETYGGTIQNLTIDSTVGRGIMISSPTEDVYLNNVVVDGPGYALNTTEHNGKNLIVTNSTFKGWISFAGLDSVSFANCKFGENTAKYWQGMGYDQDYDRLIRPYVTTTFDECEFEKDFYLSLDVLGTDGDGRVVDADATINLTDCTCNGVVITTDNYENYITVEKGTYGHLKINGVSVY